MRVFTTGGGSIAHAFLSGVPSERVGARRSENVREFDSVEASQFQFDGFGRLVRATQRACNVEPFRLESG